MGQGTDDSCDRPAEVSVIRFVSRNRTIEEIAPKKEIYICKHRGCGKIFTNQDEYKTHEALESLKIRFICKEPGCGEELPDPGSMWKHYQDWHSGDTNVFVCPYTRCSAVHATSEMLEDHIELTHRQVPRLPTEPEIICYEGSDNAIEEDINRINEDTDGYSNVRNNTNESAEITVVRGNEYSSRSETVSLKHSEYTHKEENRIVSTNSQKVDEYPMEHSKLRAALSRGDYSENSGNLNRLGTKFPKNKDLLITKENFYANYETNSAADNNEAVQVDTSQDSNNTVFITSDVSLTKTPNQDHRIELNNLEKIIRSGFERDSGKPDDRIKETKNCSGDEEYTPKKQRMSRSKQEPYKCEISGCGKTYKYISQFRHHQDTHKIVTNATNTNSTKSSKPKAGLKGHTISFFICKMPGCGAQLSNVNSLFKHYQETHANAKPPGPTTKCTEIYRCKGCGMEFVTQLILYKHYNEVHSKNCMNNTSTNIKTGNGSGVLVEQSFHNDTATLRGNFKTDLKAKHSISLNEYAGNKRKNNQSSVDNEESGG